MKKFVSIMLVLCMIFTMTACNKIDDGKSDNSGGAGKNEKTADYKIGIVTGSDNQGEEEFQAAVALKEELGDMIVTATYPDDFVSEKEAMIKTVTELASDKAVKAIIFVQAVDGMTEVIEKVKEETKGRELLFVAGGFMGNPEDIAGVADISMAVDEYSEGTSVVDQAAKQGATTFVHISFERHLAYPAVAKRQEFFKQRCKELNIQYVEANAPDPTDSGTGGVAGVEAWIADNIMMYVNEYGTDTAFFATNCSAQAALISQVAQLGAIYPRQCCPSPYHAYPEAFAIDQAEYVGKEEEMLNQIATRIGEFANEGRMSTWAVPMNTLMIKAGVNYAIKWAEGEIKDKCDEAALTAEIQALAKDATVRKNSGSDEKELKNSFLILCPFYDF